MKPWNSLKYRIAFAIFILEAIMMGAVLWQTLTLQQTAQRQQLASNEDVILQILADIAEDAVLTDEYDDLQAYVKRFIDDPHLIFIAIVDNQRRIVASSDFKQIGKDLQPLIDSKMFFWKMNPIQTGDDWIEERETLGQVVIQFSNQALLEAIGNSQRTGFSVALSGMFVIAVFGITTGFLLTRRLNKIVDAAKDLEQGNYKVRTHLKGDNEISLAGQTFDLMASKIENDIQTLQAQKVQLQQIGQEALQASEAKSRFFAVMNHELRTPMNAIIGYGEMIQEDLAGQNLPESTKDMEKILHAARHLLSIINQVLDLASMQEKKVNLHFEPINLALFFEDIKQMMLPLFQQHHLTLCYQINQALPELQADIVRLRQIFINLLNNAVKFSRQGEVILGVKRLAETVIELPLEHAIVDTTQWLLFWVEDSGIGISKDNIHKIFTEFTQVDDSSTRAQDGVGLGLSIVQQFVKVHGGHIWVVSQEGQGTTFYISMPLSH